jgi:hypothetical protein
MLGNDLLWGYFIQFSTYAALIQVPLPKGFKA